MNGLWLPRMEPDDEAQEAFGRTDHCDPGRARGWSNHAYLCRRHGISEQTFYNWKAKYGGLEVCEARRLKGLGSENAKLKSCWPHHARQRRIEGSSGQKKGHARCQANG